MSKTRFEWRQVIKKMTPGSETLNNAIPKSIYLCICKQETIKSLKIQNSNNKNHKKKNISTTKTNVISVTLSTNLDNPIQQQKQSTPGFSVLQFWDQCFLTRVL